MDAIADLSDAGRDENGSFAVTILTSEERVDFSFTRQPEGAEQGISLAYKAHCEIHQVTPLDGGGEMTFTRSRSSSGNYNLSGANVNLLKIAMPRFLPFIGGAHVPMPDKFAGTLLTSLQNAAPALLADIGERTGLALPAPAKEKPMLGLGFDL